MRLPTFLRDRLAGADPRFIKTGRWLLLSALIGIVSGLGAIVFDQFFLLCSRLLLNGIGGFQPPSPGAELAVAPFGPLAPWRLPLSLTIGALISGIFVYRTAPEAEGHGTDSVIKAFHTGLGKIRHRVPLVKMISSSITIGSGGSAGREGPVAQVGAGFGSWLGDVFHVSNRERRILMLAGVAGGIGAIFRSPLGAALFAGEVLYREPEFEYESLMPGLISAIMGYSIYASYAGWDPMFRTPKLHFEHPLELIAFAAFGVVCALGGIMYTRMFYGFRDHFFKRLPISESLRPAVGAALLGAIAMYYPQALGMGYGYVQQAIDGHLVVGWMLGFVALKMIATSLTISSGGSGGVFAPSLAIGGILGGAFGQWLHELAPSLTGEEPAAFVMVGMGAFFAGAAKVPLASVVMVMEMTGSYGLLVPTLLAATVAYILVPLRTSLYENQVDARIDSPAHLGSFAVDLLQEISVRDALPARRVLAVVREDLPCDQLLDRLREKESIAYPVVDAEGNLSGLLTLEEIRRALVRDQIGPETLVRDIAQMGIQPVTLDDELRTVLRACLEKETYVMPVVEHKGSKRVIGTLSRGEVLLAYDHELRRRRSQDDEES